MNRRRSALRLVLAATSLTLSLTAMVGAQRRGREGTAAGREVTIPVTVDPGKDRAGAPAQLQADDLTLLEEKRPQRIISVRGPDEAPPILAVLLQDDLVARVNNEIQGVKEFIRRLPAGSRVLTGYVTSGSLGVAQDFTTDLQRAADSLRIVRGAESAAPFNPYVEVVEALRRFDAQPAGRRLVLLVSDGLDTSRGFRSASPSQSVDLDRAIGEAQRRGVAVFTFYAPSVGPTSASRTAVNYGQGSLNRLADETGGEAFFTGTDFVSFNPYFRELSEVLARQWLVTYRSANTGPGFRRIEITSESGLRLHYPAGYRAR